MADNRDPNNIDDPTNPRRVVNTDPIEVERQGYITTIAVLSVIIVAITVIIYFGYYLSQPTITPVPGPAATIASPPVTTQTPPQVTTTTTPQGVSTTTTTTETTVQKTTTVH